MASSTYVFLHPTGIFGGSSTASDLSIASSSPDGRHATERGERREETHFLRLPHPRTGIPSLYLPYTPPATALPSTSALPLPSPTSPRHEPSLQPPDALTETPTPRLEQADMDVPNHQDRTHILELQAVAPEAQRSWLFKGGAVHSGEVVSNGALHILTPVDPVLILVPILTSVLHSDRDSSSRFLPLPDLFETAAQMLCRPPCSTRSQGDSQQGQEDGDQDGRSWGDVLLFGETRAARDALEKICESQQLTPDLKVYRLSSSKLISYLRARVASLSSPAVFARYPNTLGRLLAKMGLDSEVDGGGEEKLSEARDDKTKEPLDLARTKLAAELLCGWLSESVAAELMNSYERVSLLFVGSHPIRWSDGQHRLIRVRVTYPDSFSQLDEHLARLSSSTSLFDPTAAFPTPALSLSSSLSSVNGSSSALKRKRSEDGKGVKAKNASARESVGVRKLRKASTTGMKTLDTFFGKKA